MANIDDSKFNSRGEYTLYNEVDKTSDASYPSWGGGSPNLLTYLTALNQSSPIIGCQFELRMSRWPRTVFFAKNVTIPEITTNTQTLNHAGFEIHIACNPKYSSYEISFTIIADKEGYHYYDWRNMVLQSGHPLVAGDTRSTIGDSSEEDTLDVRLRNSPNDETHHHWIVHNFRPITIGSVEMQHDSSSFVTFDVTGTFTHIDYDCGKVLPQEEVPFGEAPTEEDDEPSPGFDTEDDGDEQDKSDSDGDEGEDGEGGEEGEEGGDEGEDGEQEEQAEEPSQEQVEEAQSVPDEPPKYEDLDNDEKGANDVLEEMGDDNPKAQAEMEKRLKEQYPNESQDAIETRAELALDAARRYRKGKG